MASKLIPQASAAADDTSQPSIRPPVVAPVTKAVTIPLDVLNAIQREAARDPSDPFLARRLAAHYRSGIWGPQDARK